MLSLLCQLCLFVVIFSAVECDLPPSHSHNTLTAPPRYNLSMRILLTNDDGIDAPGLNALYLAIKDLGEVHVVAPETVQSATSHAVTFHRPIRVIKHPGPGGEGFEGFVGTSVGARPADCVKLAIANLVPQPIDLVISGINAGANIGINVIYSGTVAAAREAAFIGVPAISVSQHVKDWETPIPWQDSARHARDAILRVLDGPMTPHSVVNINIPRLDDGKEPLGMKAAPISTSSMVDQYEITPADDGSFSYRACSAMTFNQREPNTDVAAIFEGYISITPLEHDVTDTRQMPRWREYIG
jgi:5'/3'-nucleotidase